MIERLNNKNLNVRKNDKYKVRNNDIVNEKNKASKTDNINRKSKKNTYTFKNIMYNFFDFFKQNLKRKTVIVYIITILILGALFTSFLSQNNNTSDIVKQAQSLSSGITSYKSQVFKEIIKSKIPILFLCIFSGIVPFFYIPALCTYFASNYIASVIVQAIVSSVGKVNLVTLSISSVLQLLGFSLAIATGIYYCINETKRFRYNEKKHTTFNDIKYKFYEYKNDSKNKAKAYDAKKKQNEKNEKLNVKIDYFNILVSFAISILIVVVSSLIALI